MSMNIIKMIKDAHAKKAGFPRGILPFELNFLHVFFDKLPEDDQQEERTKRINDAAKGFCAVMMQNCPPGAELQKACDRLRECLFWARDSMAVGRWAREEKERQEKFAATKGGQNGNGQPHA